MFPTGRGHFAIHQIDPPTGIPTHGNALLVPGFTGSKEDFLPVLAPLAAAGYRVLAVDQRGQYETPGPEDPTAYAITELGADVLALAAGLDGPVHLLGHSFGGFAARAAAIADPAAVASLTLLCSGPGPLSAPREIDRAQTFIAALENFSLEQVWSFIAASAHSAGEYEGVDEEVRGFLERRFLSSSHVGLATMAHHLLHAPGDLEALAAARVPVLVAHGEHDYIWFPAEQKEMAARLGARYTVVAGAAHSPAVEAPTPTVEVLIDFWGSAHR